MPRRALTTGFVLTTLITMLFSGTALGAAQHQSSPMMWHPQTGMAGAVGGGAAATLVRRSNGVSFDLRTSGLRPGHAYTIWFVVLNNPAACSARPCNAQDILLNAATDAQVTYGAGHVVGASGRGGFAGSFQVGEVGGWLPGGRLVNPLGAEIQLVINDHGPKLPAFMPGMIQTYRAGCTDASLPGIFPASAKADGAPGPNACQLYQVAVFSGS